MTNYFVSIVGGFWALDEEDIDQGEQARAYARELGAALAEAGLGLVVYFSNDESLEPHVVTGYVEQLSGRPRPKSIRVRYSSEQRDQVKFPEQSSAPELFDSKIAAQEAWESPFYSSLVDGSGENEVDGVLLMSGQYSTRIAGHVAITGPLPVLAIDRFGGSASEIWKELQRQDRNYPQSNHDTPQELVAWLRGRIEARASERSAEDERRKRLTLLEQRHRQAGSTFASLVALVGALSWGLSGSGGPDLFFLPTLLTIFAAGSAGALGRSILWPNESTTVRSTMVLGMLIAFAVTIAYAIPFLYGAGSFLDASGDEVSPTSKAQLITFTVVALAAGASFEDGMLQLWKRGKEVVQSIAQPPREKD